MRRGSSVSQKSRGAVRGDVVRSLRISTPTLRDQCSDWTISENTLDLWAQPPDLAKR
jgi:hypothetical protein